MTFTLLRVNMVKVKQKENRKFYEKGLYSELDIFVEVTMSLQPFCSLNSTITYPKNVKTI